MSKTGRRIIDGLQEAIAFAKGERFAARIHVNGHTYVSEREAADRIAALEADARSEAAKALRADGELHEALARIAELEAALSSIARNTCCEGCQEAARVARAALSPTPER